MRVRPNSSLNVREMASVAGDPSRALNLDQSIQDNRGLWSFVLYVFAVIVGLFLYQVYEPKQEEKENEYESDPRYSKRKRNDFRLSSIYAVLGLSANEIEHFEAFEEHFITFEEVSEACRKAGLEDSNLIIGVDFTASNEWQGRKSFNQNCLHKVIGNKVYNPYQKVIWILGQTLQPFDQDNMIPAYGFGDSTTIDEEVFPFNEDDLPCKGFERVLDRYNDIARRITLAGPTSFAPIIHKAIQIVRATKKYHILVIIADGQVTEEKPTIDAIVEASNHPISIVVVGVGDGPWDVMEEFDHRLPKRKFDNFRFVDYHKATFKSKNPDTAFALQALMEIPDQYKSISKLGYLEESADNTSMSSDGSSLRECTPSNSPHVSPTHKRSGESPKQSLRQRRKDSGLSITTAV